MKNTPLKLCIWVTFALTSLAAADDDSKLVARGKYLATIMDCSGCHTPGSLAGEPDFNRYLAGSQIGFGLGPAIEGSGPAGGTVYPPNLTPDMDTGIGSWTYDQIIAAVTLGTRPDGRQLEPIMPWPSYAALTEDDRRALVAFLKSLPAISHEVPAPVSPGDEPTAPYLGVIVPE